MLLPFESVVRRGVILLWKQYADLDDPLLAIVYILTTSQKPKHILR